ncbi:glycosyltransferase family 4 protein [Asticcacaulis sp. AC402]|uniref:glycosyltransferase family 4 protein n=1 Tax=Asticcacaulis sp. AC402 TaxID=1282361 RepID=UPI0003C3C0F6|nr:glycosyltransferase family 4 protein [Asticcacaulis sp. AC402]ESQ77560.1 glycosyl transferase family 1 [Asticcacaulis sp. AC402]
MTTSSFTGCVLQVVPELDTGGVEQTVLDVSAAILKAGGRSIVATKGGRLVESLQKAGATVVLMPVHSKNPLTQFKNHKALRALIRREKVDIVHVRSRAPAMAAIGAARAEKIRSVATYHGIYNAKSGLKRWYNSQMTRADMTIANSDYTRDHILKTYNHALPERVISIPRGVDLHRFDPEGFDVRKIMKLDEAWGTGNNDTRNRFLLAARLTRWKGQVLIIEAANLLKQQGITDFLILIAGDDQGRTEYRAELEKLIDSHGLQNQVKLVGHVSDMPSAYSLCHFALAPSLEPEAFGRTAVEPQAMQRPPLAAAHGATVETVADGITGWLVKPGDAAAWADAIKIAMALSDEVRFDMGVAGRAHVKAHFGLDGMCERTLDVYRALLILTSRKYNSRVNS